MSMAFNLNKPFLTEYAAEVMVYFEKHRIMDIVARLLAEIVLVRPEDTQLWMARNITRIAKEIYTNCMQLSYNGGQGPVNFYQVPGRYLYRVVMYGRHGSGRKTQARTLVNRFKLVYVDAEQEIYQCLRASNDDLAEQLQQAFHTENIPLKSKLLAKILFRRILQMDALRYGWVMVNYPNTLRDLKRLFERCKTPPNKLIYLQCPEDMAKQRLAAQPYLGRPQNNCNSIEEEMIYYREHEAENDDYLAHRHETIYVDSTPCFEVVKNCVLSEISRQPYVLGYKS